MAYFFVPAHSHEETDPVDNLGGLLSLIMVGSLTLAINFSTVRSMRTEVLVLAALVFITGAWFVYRQLHEAHPLYDLRVASRRTFWVAACSDTIVFGALMGAMFLGQQFIQVVLGYSTIDASMAILPSPLCTLLAAGYSAYLVRKFGSRFTLLAGAALTFFLFPKHQVELDVLAEYRSEDPAFAEGGAQIPGAAQ